MVAQYSPSGPREIRRYVDSGVEKIFFSTRDSEAAVQPVRFEAPNRGEALVAAKLFGRAPDGILVVSGIAKHLWSDLVVGERHRIDFDGTRRPHEHTVQRCTRFALQGELEIVLMSTGKRVYWPDQLRGDDALTESGILVAELLGSPPMLDLLKANSSAMSLLKRVVDLESTELFVDDAMYQAVMENSGHWPPVGM